jgi:hypothetical protein
MFGLAKLFFLPVSNPTGVPSSPVFQPSNQLVLPREAVLGSELLVSTEIEITCALPD